VSDGSTQTALGFLWRTISSWCYLQMQNVKPGKKRNIFFLCLDDVVTSETKSSLQGHSVTASGKATKL
jgi:hypothetical protein